MEFQLIKYVRRALAFCIVKHIKKKLKLLKLVEVKEKLKHEDLKLDYVGSYGNEEHKAMDSELPVFDFGMIATSVNNFSDHNKLGQGGFGPVYKGNLPEGQEIAVKRLSKMSGQGITEFMNEVALVSKLQHRNLVQLLGCCIDGEEKLLLYEFMPNKSLDCFLFDSIKKRLLDWPRRYSIIEGIARGLLYLHRDSRLRIIHRDMKASNILLDELFNAKISDFGLARMFKGDQILATTKRVVGTIGYMSPEYAMEGRFSEKSDVFSFGVLILEILSGKRNNSFVDEEQYVTLIGYAWALWSSNKALELIDQSIGETFSKPEVLKCIQVGLLCVQEYPSDRPTMSTVVSMLSTDTCLPSPKQAAFFGRTSPRDLFPCFEEEICSMNDLTITEVGCR